MAAVYDHIPWTLWPPAVSRALCGIPTIQQAGTPRYTDTGKQLNKQAHKQTIQVTSGPIVKQQRVHDTYSYSNVGSSTSTAKTQS